LGIVVPAESWKDMVEKIDEEYLLNSFDASGKIVASILARNDIALTLDSFIEFILYGTVVYSGSVSHFHHYKDGSDDTILVFEHPFGIKWSKILGKSISRFLNGQFNMATHLVTSARNAKIIIHSSPLTFNPIQDAATNNFG
jgi:hypothetical protein